jgi:tRNA uridine 5-carboxymethylaminomethyl modification enzyme
MFTSRAEYRLSLREDNADLRLTDTGRSLGLVNEARWRRYSDKREAIEHEQSRLTKTYLVPGRVNEADVARLLGMPLAREASLMELLRRPEVSYASLMHLAGPGVDDPEMAQQLEIQAKYSGYIERQHEEIEHARRHAETRLPEHLDYASVHGLSTEECQKLTQHRPATLGQAARLSGVTPAAISLLLVHLKRARG